VNENTLAVPENLLDVVTGEVLPATPANAARVLQVAREMKGKIDVVIKAATAYLAEESRVRGTKTFQLAEGKVTLSGGTTIEYDPELLVELLREAGCPEERITAAVAEIVTVSYKVDRAVLRQLGAANPDYGAAIALSQRTIEKPYNASVKQ
jgi:hypothetical protein